MKLDSGKLAVLALYILLAGAVLVGILNANGGTFTYAMDDPYIHLTLADNLSHGHYGINLQEKSAPSSSVLWGPLLAPFARLPFFVYVPLVLNLVFGWLAVDALGRLSSRIFGAGSAGWSPYLGLFLAICLNLYGLIFEGMEHVLQVWLTLLLAEGLFRVFEDDSAPWWLAPVLVLGPLVRFENLALTLPAIGCLLLAGKHRTSLLSLAGVAFTLGAFSWFLHSQGLGWLPSSVTAKAGSGELFDRLLMNIRQSSGFLLAVPTLICVWIAIRRQTGQTTRVIAAVFAVGAAGFLFKGKIDNTYRYEMFLWAGFFVCLLQVMRPALALPQDERKRAMHYVSVALLMALALIPQGWFMLKVPLAANDIYVQHIQMRRFIDDYWQAPVAANDIGVVSLRNEQYVLDLFGLGSEQALRSRQTETDPAWMNELAAKNGVKLAMIYDLRGVFPDLPESWVRLGELRMDRKPVVAAHHTVTFFAIDHSVKGEALHMLLTWHQELPPGADFIPATTDFR